MKVMALDFGSARTGVALSDPTGTIARPFGVVFDATSRVGRRRLVELVAAEQVELVVVGMPLTMRGARGDQAKATEAFVDELRKVVSVPVVTYDERFTTDLAERTPADPDTPEDALAAAHLLSGYLEWSSAARA
jgi:putative Holliday junction resolvase